VKKPRDPSKPKGKATYRRRDPLPNFDGTPFGRFGCLTDAHLKVIHADERWYNDGDPHWKKAPSSSAAVAKRVAAADRLEHLNFGGVAGAPGLALIIRTCMARTTCGSHACPECARAGQRWLVTAFGNVLRKPKAGFQDYSFNFVMPDGQVAIFDLGSAPFDLILNRCREALDKCEAVEFAVLGIDTSFNDDTEKFKEGRLTKGPRKYWQVHVYGIVRTSDRQAVWNALRHLFVKAENIYRPLTISTDPFDGSPGGISYVCKPDGFRRPLYKHPVWGWIKPRKQPALTARQHVYYLLAMHHLGFARRIAFVGLHPFITVATKKSKRGVALRKVSRRRLPCS
jgi:hypothetical protein